MKKEVYVFTDFDGTITSLDLGDHVFKEFGQFEPYQSQLLSREINIYTYWKILCDKLNEGTSADNIREYCIKQDTDAYFVQFAKFCNEKEYPLSVISDGFDIYINPILEKLNLSYLPVYCNNLVFNEQNKAIPHFPRATEGCDCFVASCKRNSILMQVPIDAVIVYIGDGYSDYCAAEHSDIVFAKRHLAAYCFKHKIPHHTFNSFFDVIQILKKLEVNGRLKTRHQAFLKRKSAFENE